MTISSLNTILASLVAFHVISGILALSFDSSSSSLESFESLEFSVKSSAEHGSASFTFTCILKNVWIRLKTETNWSKLARALHLLVACQSICVQKAILAAAARSKIDAPDSWIVSMSCSSKKWTKLNSRDSIELIQKKVWAITMTSLLI